MTAAGMGPSEEASLNWRKREDYSVKVRVMKIQKAVPLGIVLLGILLLMSSVLIYRHTKAFIRESSVASGVVTGFVTSTDREGERTYRPRVSFSVRDYEQVEFVSGVGSNPPSYTVGQRVSVLYNPADTGSAEINSFFSLWFGFILVSAIGFGFVVVGGIVFSVFRKIAEAETLMI